MVLFFPLFRISPLYCGAASSISFCSATPVLLAAFVVLSICFSCWAGCKRIQAISWILLLFNIDTEWWKVNCNTVFHFPHSDTLLQPVRCSLPFHSSVSNFCLPCYATQLPAAASQHMGTRYAGEKWLMKLLPSILSSGTVGKLPLDPHQVFHGGCNKPQHSAAERLELQRTEIRICRR